MHSSLTLLESRFLNHSHRQSSKNMGVALKWQFTQGNKQQNRISKTENNELI